MTTVSQPLQSEALAFLDAIEQDKANAESRAAEMEQANLDLTRQLANANDTIAKHEATIAQQQATIAQMEAASQQPAVEPRPEPSNPEPSNPEPEPTSDAYSRDKVIAGLIAIKGSKTHAFGIVDVCGNVYADEAEWILDGKPQVLGIGYTDGTIHLCLLPKKAGTAPFGFSGAMVPGVYHTKAQWKKDSKPGKPSAYEDYSGAANSDALVKAQDEAEDMAAGISAAAQNTAVFKAHSLVSARGKRGYLPPCGEMRIYCANHKKVDPLLTAVGGDKLRTRTGNANEGFWTSTCINETQAWIAMFSDSNSQPAQRQKLTNFNVRAFVEL